MKHTVVALFIVAGALVPGVAANAAAQPATAPVVVAEAAGLGTNPPADIALFRASAQADHDARLAEARAAAAAAEAAAQAAAAEAAAAASAAVAAQSAPSEWVEDDDSWDAGDAASDSVTPAAAAAPAAEAAPQPTTPRPDNSDCGPCPAETLEWIVYDGVGYWACP